MNLVALSTNLEIIVSHQVHQNALEVEVTDKDTKFKKSLECNGLIQLSHLLHQSCDGHLLEC